MNSKFFNRELSWIEFNKRVLHEALRKDVPLLERLQFLSIVTSNFDEFFQVRVAGLKRLAKTGGEYKDVSALSLGELLKEISKKVHETISVQYECLRKDILPMLEEKKLVKTSPADFTTEQKDYAQNFFKTEIFPLLTPLRTDGELFPNINNLSTYVAFLLKPISGIHAENNTLMGKDDVPRIAIVEVPQTIEKLVWLPNSKKEKCFTLTEDIIAHYGSKLFSGFETAETLIFKVSRDADFAVDEDSGVDFVHEMEKVLVQRRSSFAVTLTCTEESVMIRDFLSEKLGLGTEDIYIVPLIVNISSLLELRNTDEGTRLSFPEWQHFYPPELDSETPFWDILRTRDVLLNVPYESYDPVIKFVNDAAEDKDVLSIKMTLYRTGGGRSPLVNALEKAARNGKQVVVLVELKARFDEERNIAWASELENAGVTVVYGLVNLKVHAKVMMIMRRENGTIRRYVHLSTGNYNPKTARLYSDLSLFTANFDIANDATHFFNLITGYSTLQTMNKLSMAPVTLKSKLISMIEREIEREKHEKGGLIIAKMNSLTHEEVIDALYRASNAGVKVMLNVRGICMLVPGVKGQSENIKVVSVVDRYLEHARIFYFGNGNNPEIYLSSADWMNRNLDRRIELMFPILDRNVFKEVYSILRTYFHDNLNSHTLTPTGDWILTEKVKNHSYRAQEVLYKRYKKLSEAKLNAPRVDFEVRRKE